MIKNIVMILHHAATLISVTESGIFLKRQRKKRICLILFFMTQCFAVLKMIVGYIFKKDFYLENSENLQKNLKEKYNTILITMVSISVFLKIGIPLALVKEKKE